IVQVILDQASALQRLLQAHLSEENSWCLRVVAGPPHRHRPRAWRRRLYGSHSCSEEPENMHPRSVYKGVLWLIGYHEEYELEEQAIRERTEREISHFSAAWLQSNVHLLFVATLCVRIGSMQGVWMCAVSRGKRGKITLGEQVTVEVPLAELFRGHMMELFTAAFNI
ncbi:unnamed protein product, partial [Prorocentrum cordatum]